MRYQSVLPIVLTLAACAPAGHSSDTQTGVTAAGITAGDVVTFTSKHSGRCIDVPSSSKTSGVQVQQYSCNGTNAQNFDVKAAANGAFTFTNANSGLCLDVLANATTNGDKIVQATCSGASEQAFTLSPSGSDYSIKTASSHCLQVTGNSTANSALIEEWTCSGADDQLFSISISGSGSGSGGSPPSAQGSHVPLDDLEVVGPFSSWANVKTVYNAKGDGMTNDAPALQKALNDLGRVGKASVLYLPAGTYVIESTLTYNAPINPSGHGDVGVSIVGDAPTTTIIKWKGPSGGAMFNQDGGFNVGYSRMTLDGQKTAGFGISQAWNSVAKTTPAGGSSEHVDMIFQDMNIGILAGKGASDKASPYHQLDSEGQIRRVTFLRMGYAGLDVGSYNALDWWVIDSQFIDGARGVTNLYDGEGTPTQTEGASDEGANLGAGGFYVYRSLFQGSKVADAEICNAGAWLSFHDNVSIGSQQLFRSCTSLGHSGDETIFANNRIVDTVNPTAISNGNMGAIILVDNEFRSATSEGPIVDLDPGSDSNGGDIISIGNKYTVSAANYFKKAGSNDRVLSNGDSTVAASSIGTAAPSLPPTPSRMTRQIFEVPANGSEAEIQAAVNDAAAAAAKGAVNPIVHLPTGSYSISSPIVVPAKAKLQIVGDSQMSALYWSGGKNSSFFTLEGPSYATIRNLYMYGPNGSTTAIDITDADQAGGRIFIQGSLPGILQASNLASTEIAAQQNTGFAELQFTNVANFVAVGTGGIGPVTASDSNITIVDTWNEGVASKLYRLTGGNLTLMGAQLCPASHASTLPKVPAFDFESFDGHASIIGVALVLTAEPNGIGLVVGPETAKTNIMVLGSGASDMSFFDRKSSGGNVGVINSRGSNGNGSVQYPNTGDQSDAFIDSMLVQRRALIWDTAPYVAPAGATDVRIYRVNAADTNGLVVTGH